MTLSPGTRLGPYEISGSLGAGGMGEVYRAKDTRLGRTVAIKVLPPDLAAAPERRRRFEQEARAVSALNHPHICTLYDVGSVTLPDQPGAPPTEYLVMEYLEGQSLADRLGKGPLPVREVLDIGAQVADALAKAHRHGILHRDIKPGNVMLTKAGAKLLDFGLAKARPGSTALDDGQTVSMTRGPVTSAGLVVGTVPYMAPEVLEGKEADARVDIFALGAMLYEMVAGQRPFGGESQASLIASILTADPTPLTELAAVTPPALDRLVRRCLAKDPDDRWQSAGDIARQLEGLAEELRLPSSGTQTRIPVAAPATSWRRRAAWAALGVSVLAAVGAGAYRIAERHAQHPQPTFHRLTFRQGIVYSARFTADGLNVLYTAAWEGRPTQTFMVRTDGVDSEPRDALKGRAIVSISARNEVAMLGGMTLATAPLTGGTPKAMAEQVSSADWSPDGAQLAVVRWSSGRRSLEYPFGKVIYRADNPEVQFSDLRVSPGGELVAFFENASRHGYITVIDRMGEKRVQSEQIQSIGGKLAWSPDGKEVWFSRLTGAGTETIRALDLSGRERTVLRSPGLELFDVSRDGRVLLVNRNAVISIFGRGPGDTAERNLTYYGWSLLQDISPDGRSILFTEGGESNPESDWSAFIRSTDGSPPQALGRGYVYGKLSPDGRWAAVNKFTDKGNSVALVPIGAGDERLLTKVEQVPHNIAGWLPDSSAVLFGSGDRVWLAPVNGEPRAITPEGWWVTGGSAAGVFREDVIAPDGRHYLCGNNLPDDDWLYLCAIDAPVSTSLPRYVDLSKWRAIGWTADGRRLRVHNWAPGIARRLFLLDPATGAAEPWQEIGAHLDPAGLAGINRLYFSADGESYAYQIQRQLATLYVAEGVK
jgi:hypothetical protein